MNAVLAFIKKNLRDVIIFGTAAVVSIVLVAVLLSWTVKGDREREVQVRTATLVAEDLQTEYLVRQEFSADGASLDIGGEFIPIEDCGINADFSSAGEKTVEIVYRKNDFVSYVARVDVSVLFVRSIAVESYPAVASVEDGKFSADEGLGVYATLAQLPKSDRFGTAEATEYGYKIKLDDGLYSTTCVRDTALDGFYTVSFFCGDVSTGFSFYNAAGKSYVVSSPKDIVLFDADSDDGSALTLIVTDRDDRYQYDCNGSTAGCYVHRAADGTETEHAFAYSLTDMKKADGSTVTEERFDSDGVAEANGGDVYTARIGDAGYTATAALFQSAVVNGSIVEDGGYKLVVGSDKRILPFEYVPKEPTDAARGADVPTLTLYVTEYDMNPTLGTGNGYSRGVYIFTDTAGRSYKIKFYMQSWVWTFVPLSSSHGDAYSEAKISDIVKTMDESGNWHYNTFRRGALYTDVSRHDRELGSVTDSFIAAEELWLGAIMGM